MAVVLLLGAGGFIGSAIAHALIDDGYSVVGFGRNLRLARRLLPEVEWHEGDLRAMTSAENWSDHLRGVEIVINASGALQSGLRDDPTIVQRDAILALFEAADTAGITHFIQISAAGADTGPTTEFMSSKATADAALLAGRLACTVLRPGLVIGRNAFGGSELLRTAAGLPLVAPELAGTGSIQCVALSDVVGAVRSVLADPANSKGSFDLVERQGRSLGAVIAAHRSWLGITAARWRLELPLAALTPATLCADMLGWLGWRSPLRSNAVAALAAGVRGDPGQTCAILGREPFDLTQSLAALGPAGKADRWHARLALVYPLALIVLGLTWLASGLLGLMRTEAASAVLVQGGFEPRLARLAVLAGSVADLAMAGAILFRPWLKSALKAGLALACAYCLGSFAVRPDLWLDPLGPMLKVLSFLTLTLACLAMADER